MFEKESIRAFFGILIHCLDQYWYFNLLFGSILDPAKVGSNLYPKCLKRKAYWHFWQFNSLFGSILAF